MVLTLITGPVRSGKSRFAEQLASAAGGDVTYVATAGVDLDDAEWCARLEHHRRRRPAGWKVVETAGGLGDDLRAAFVAAPVGGVLLVDSLGSWLADRMLVAHASLPDEPLALEAALDADCASLVAAMLASPARAAFVVGEETGWGIVPEYRSARIFRDVLGRLQQAIAARAERVYLTVSGIALELSATGIPIVGAAA